MSQNIIEENQLFNTESVSSEYEDSTLVKPEFKPLLEYENEKFKFCTQPNYKHFQVSYVALITSVFLIMQLFSSFIANTSADMVRNQRDKNGVQLMNTLHFNWIESLTIIISLTVINVLMKHKREQFLIKVSGFFIFVAAMLLLIVYSCQLISSLQIYKKVNESSTVNCLIAYSIFACITAAISKAFQIVACFCYMIKCMPKVGNKGLVVCIFLLAVVLGKSLYMLLDNLSSAADLHIATYAAALASLPLIFYADKLPIPQFGVTEIDVNQAAKVLKSKERIHNSMQFIERVEYIQDDRQSANVTGTEVDFNEFQVNSGKSKLQQVVKQHEIKNEKQSIIPQWLQFYYIFMFKTTNGLLLLLQSGIYVMLDAIHETYEKMDLSGVADQCNEFTGDISCWPDTWFFSNMKWLSIIIESITIIAVGYTFDLASMWIKNQNRLLLYTFSIVSFMVCVVITIPTLTTLTSYLLRDFYIVMLMMVSSMQMVFLQLNLITMFKGAYRVAVCMVFTMSFMFEFIINLLQFQNLFLNLLVPMFTFCFIVLCWVALALKLDNSIQRK